MDETTLKNLIATELDIQDAPEDVKDELFAELGETIMMRTTLAILKQLSLLDQEEFTTIAENGGHQSAYNFASSKIENFQDFVRNEALQEILELKKD